MAYTDKAFFDKIKPYVIEDMKKTGILASLTAAQAFIESNKGNSGLTQKANNLFGIKGTYDGECVKMLTTEYYNGVPCGVYANFLKYPSWAESIADHSSLFNRLNRYKNLRGEKDYVKACKNVQADGYATSPTYASTLINTINKYRLYEWDYINNGDGTFTPAPNPETINYPTLSKGSFGYYVLAWQMFLNQNGYPCGDEDGIFGKNTKLAVIEYQKAKKLTPDGVIGPATWGSLPKS
ncbi:MAG: glucosaminidase domain-containing protein [Bacteroidota bacterium]|nr:glucosaminidase domain-containing protein [Bacteroidota bacterium]